MKKILLSLGVSILLASSVYAAASAEVTFNVVKFRPVTVANQGTQYTDATMTLAPHPLVSVTGIETDATLHPTAPVDFEITIVSVDSKETYIPTRHSI